MSECENKKLGNFSESKPRAKKRPSCKWMQGKRRIKNAEDRLALVPFLMDNARRRVTCHADTANDATTNLLGVLSPLSSAIRKLDSTDWLKSMGSRTVADWAETTIKNNCLDKWERWCVVVINNEGSPFARGKRPISSTFLSSKLTFLDNKVTNLKSGEAE